MMKRDFDSLLLEQEGCESEDEARQPATPTDPPQDAIPIFANLGLRHPVVVFRTDDPEGGLIAYTVH